VIGLGWLASLAQSAGELWQRLRTPSVPLELQHVWDRTSGAAAFCIMCNAPLTPTTQHAVCPRFSDTTQSQVKA